MKKKVCIMLLMLCTATAFVACNNNGTAGSETEADADMEDASQSGEDSAEDSEVTADTRIVSVSKEDMDQYVTLGEYKGISVDQEVEEVTEGDIDYQVDVALQQNQVESEDPEATVKDGDTVNINYVGTKDGVAFDGGTADNYDLAIGSGAFIDGFEEGLIGCKKGDTVDLNLTFPDGYQAEDLAGQDVVFTVTINSILVTPELTDEWVQANTEYDSIEAYRESVREDLETNNREVARNAAMNQAWSQVVENSEIKEYPQEDIDKMVEEYNDSLKEYAEQAGMEEDEFLESQNMTREEFDAQGQEYAEYRVGQNLIIQALMDAEDFTLVDEESKDAEAELAANYGLDDLSFLVQEYGQSMINEYVALARVSQFVIDNAVVNEVIATEDGKQGIDLGDEE